MHRYLAMAAMAVLPGLAQAQAQYIPGTWHCVMNSVPATVDMVVQLGADFTAYAEGTWILNQGPGMNGPRVEPIRAPGRWNLGADPSMPGQIVLALQLVPGNVPSFSIFPSWIGDPNALRSVVPSPVYPGTSVEYACQRLR